MIGQHIKDALAPVLFVFFVIGLVAVMLHCTAGCHLFKDPETPALPNYCYDETELRAKVLACVAKAQTKAESQACRKQVNKSCGIEETP